MHLNNSRLQNSGKPEVSGSTIGFKFHANAEELEEMHSVPENCEEKTAEASENPKSKAVNLTPEIQCQAKAESNDDVVPDAVRDHWNLLGRKSSGTDSAAESAFSNPIETWKKLNVLKEKIAKTVEEKISEMKIDRGVLGKSSRHKLNYSKDSSSISDSEDTSESSKVSEQWKDAENQVSSFDNLANENSETCSSNLDSPELEKVLEERQMKESESELRNRKISANVSDLVQLPDIKVATAKSELEGSLLEESFTEEVESGIEAAEHLESTDAESVDAFDGSTTRTGGGSQTPSGGTFSRIAASFTSVASTHSYTIVLLLSFVLYFMFPLPDFVRGFLLSLLLAVSWGIIKGYLRPEDASFSQRSFVMPDYKSMPPLKVPEYRPVKGVWVNEYEQELYDPDYYSVTQTLPAYLELEDSILKLSRPKGRIRKRATFDEPEYKLQFTSRRIYNIGGCNVYLMPDGLTKKRYLFPKTKRGKEVEEKDESAETEEAALTASDSLKSKSTLYLFARCDRQKQEWYRRLLAATRLTTSPGSPKTSKTPEAAEDTENSDESPSKEPLTPFENLFFDDDVALLEEYLHYMTKFVEVEITRQEVKVKASSPWYRKLRAKKKDGPGPEDDVDKLGVKKAPPSVQAKNTSSAEGSDEKKAEETCQSFLQIQWFNAFVNRILFDVFRSPYWLSKIHDKLQRKLNSIRLPYYIEDIEVVEMDLGKTGPMFHRVSPPRVDELGLWFDMDATFDGLIRLTIQTHLNLVKLQKGIEESETAHIAEKMKKEKKKHKEERDAFLAKESFSCKAQAPLRPIADTVVVVRFSCKSLHNLFPPGRKEKSNEYVVRKNKKLASTPEEVPPGAPGQDAPDLECRSCEDCTKLIDEVAQFAEIAVEESLSGSREKACKPGSTGSPHTEQSDKSRSAIYDSELEDSAESSDEDEEEEEEGHSSPQRHRQEEQSSVSPVKRYPKDRRSSKRIFKVFENVAQSKYFRSMAQSKYIQRAIAGVSAARLRLTLEIKSCTGTLAINVPPPPSDRFWYGFREMPKLVFSANPKIGDKALRFAHIRNYLQKKILRELKKVMVAPNMIDFVLPTSVQAQGSHSPQLEDPDLQEGTP